MISYSEYSSNSDIKRYKSELRSLRRFVACHAQRVREARRELGTAKSDVVKEILQESLVRAVSDRQTALGCLSLAASAMYTQSVKRGEI